MPNKKAILKIQRRSGVGEFESHLLIELAGMRDRLAEANLQLEEAGKSPVIREDQLRPGLKAGQVLARMSGLETIIEPRPPRPEDWHSELILKPETINQKPQTANQGG
jgi:hypothetical protein